MAAEIVEARRVAGFRVVVLRLVAFRVVGFFAVDDEAVRRVVEAGFGVVAAAAVAADAVAAGLAVDLVALGVVDAVLVVAAFADAALVVVAFAVADRFGPVETAARFEVLRPADAGLAADGTAFAAAALARVPAAAARAPVAAARVPAALPAVFARDPTARPALFARVVTAFAVVPATALARVPAARARVPVARVAALVRLVAALRAVEERVDPLAELRLPRPRGPALIGDTACAAVAAAEPTSFAVAPSARDPVPAAARARSPMRATRVATSAAASPAWRWRFATCLRPLDASALASWPRRFASVARAASSCLPSFRSSFAAFPVTGADACCAAATRSPTAPRTSAGTLEALALRDPFVDFAIARYSLSSSALCARTAANGTTRTSTPRTHPTAVRGLVSFLVSEGMPTDQRRITHEHINAYLDREIESTSPATARLRRTYASVFFSWLIEEGELTDDRNEDLATAAYGVAVTQARQALIALIILALFVAFLVWAAMPAQIEPMPLG